MTRWSRFAPRALLGWLLAASGCADLVGLGGDYHAAPGTGGRGLSGSAGLGSSGGGTTPGGGASGSGASSAQSGAGETGGAGESGTGETGGGGALGAGRGGGGTPAGQGGGGAGRDAQGAQGGGGTAGEAGMSAGSAGAPLGPECGDGQLDSGEACDDNNDAPGDGCSAKCKVEPGWVCTRVSPSQCTRPSCVGLQGSSCQGEDCCGSPLVDGGTITQGPDQSGGHETFESTVSTFRLDQFEVTVARFRKFVNAYDEWLSVGQPLQDSGANLHVNGTGWDLAWPLPSSATMLKTALFCTSDQTQTWAETGNDTLPINCVNWYTAFAFCIWDGGRLPTESEFEYAAAGGSDNSYVYPWGNTPVPTDLKDSTRAYANYDCMGDNSDPGVCSLSDILDVGSKTTGHGFYLQEDLAGSMWEWEFDWKDTYPSSARTNYAGAPSGSSRSVRGGSWIFNELYLERASRSDNDPLARYSDIGFRCARDP